MKIFFVKILYYIWALRKPKTIRQHALKFVPWKTYQLKDTKQFAKVTSFSESGTLTAYVLPTHSQHSYKTANLGNYVFGIQPNDLEEREISLDKNITIH